MNNCTHCGTPLPDNLSICDYCFSQDKPDELDRLIDKISKGCLIIVGLGIVILIIIFIV
jgi:uncharacterized membrane protein YvbJ